MARVKHKTVEDYLDAQPEAATKALLTLRRNILKIIPGTEEYIAWGMPMFRYKGRGLICYAGFKNHCSLFIMSTKTTKELMPALKNLEVNGVTIRFQFNKPLPLTALKKIIKARMKEIDAKLAAKKKVSKKRS